MASASSPNSSPSAIPPATTVTPTPPFNTTPPPISNATSPLFPPVTLSPPPPSSGSDPSSAPPPLALPAPSSPSPPWSPPPTPQVTSSPPPLPPVAHPPSSPELPLPSSPPLTFPPPPTLLQTPPSPAFPIPLPPENSPPLAAISPPPLLLQPPPPQVQPKPPVTNLSPPHSTSSSPPPPTVKSPPSPSSLPPLPPTSTSTPPFISQTTPPPANPHPRQMISPPPISTDPPPQTLQNGSSTSRSSTSPSASFPLDMPNPSGPDIASDSTGTGHDGISSGAVAGISILTGVLIVSLIFLALWFVRKRKKGSARSRVGYTEPSLFGSSPASDASVIWPHYANTVVRSGSEMRNSTFFPYEELLQATKGFSTDNLLGEGGFGRVYKGCLSDGREVAVKQLKIGGGQGEREFRAEMEIITRVHHRHLVSLVGYCISDHQRLLVYDFVPNNTLHHHLHGHSGQFMDWETRVKVATGAARGIAYLHEDCHPRIIHRDIKSSNILLDHNFEARVSDFGLAKLALDAYTHVTTRVMGTFGYLAPEYASSGKLTEKSDVFSFGVVLLELITGRKPVDTSQPMGDESLVEWARPLLTKALEHEEFSELIDPMVKMNFVKDEMLRMIEVAAACIRHYASKRPQMSQVVRVLDAIHELPDLNNGLAPGKSVLFDSSQQSAQIRMFQRMAFGSREHTSDFDDMSGSGWSSYK